MKKLIFILLLIISLILFFVIKEYRLANHRFNQEDFVGTYVTNYDVLKHYDSTSIFYQYLPPRKDTLVLDADYQYRSNYFGVGEYFFGGVDSVGNYTLSSIEYVTDANLTTFVNGTRFSVGMKVGCNDINLPKPILFLSYDQGYYYIKID